MGDPVTHPFHGVSNSGVSKATPIHGDGTQNRGSLGLETDAGQNPFPCTIYPIGVFLELWYMGKDSHRLCPASTSYGTPRISTPGMEHIGSIGG